MGGGQYRHCTAVALRQRERERDKERKRGRMGRAPLRFWLRLQLSVSHNSAKGCAEERAARKRGLGKAGEAGAAEAGLEKGGQAGQ